MRELIENLPDISQDHVPLVPVKVLQPVNDGDAENQGPNQAPPPALNDYERAVAKLDNYLTPMINYDFAHSKFDIMKQQLTETNITYISVNKLSSVIFETWMTLRSKFNTTHNLR